jgi:dienelactone hydrolase
MAPPVDPDALEGFERASVTLLGQTRDVYSIGSGPAVLVVHEVPGITPLVAAFGRKVAERGMTAVLPDLFGTPGRPPSPGYLASSMLSACIRREFAVLATDTTSPVARWLLGLAHRSHEACGGPGVGVVGMCLTGGIALGMMVDPVVVAPVLSQPSTPFPLTKAQRRSIGLAPEDLEAARSRAAAGTCVLGLRFTGDAAVPPERFERLRAELGENFVGVEIDSSEGNPWGYKARAHSVLTEDYSDEAGSPTRAALEQVLEFFSSRLGVAS